MLVHCKLSIVPYKNQQLCPVGLLNCIFTETFFSRRKQQTTQLQKVTNTALETLLNELFTLNPENNEQTINEYIKQQQINMA